MKSLVLALFLTASLAHADGVYTRTVVRVASSSGSASATTPGGATTNVQYNNNGSFGADSGLTYISSTGTITPNFYGVNTSLTASNTEVLYVSGTAMDGAKGLNYDRINNRVTIGTPTGAAPSFDSSLRVSGTLNVTGNASITTVAATNITGVNNISGTMAFCGGQWSLLSNGLDSVTFNPCFRLIFGAADGTGGIVPNVDGGYNIGASDLRWGNIYAVSTTVTTLTAAGAVSLTGLPLGTAARNLCVTSAGGVISTSTLSGCLGVSDPKVKTDLQPLQAGLKQIMAIDTITYRDIREGAFQGRQVGVLAYGVDRDGRHWKGLEEAVPELVDENASTWHGQELKGAIYERLGVLALKGIQEQQREIEELRLGIQPRSTLWERLRWLLCGI